MIKFDKNGKATRFQDTRFYTIGGDILNQTNEELLKVNKYRNRKNEYKKAYLELLQENNDLKLYISVLEEDIDGLVEEGKEWSEANESLQADLVTYDELVDEQRKVINELVDMCEMYSKNKEELDNEITELNSEITELTSVIEDLDGKLDFHDDAHVELQDEIDRIDEELQDFIDYAKDMFRVLVKGA